jgi:CRISPR-associated protein Csm1
LKPLDGGIWQIPVKEAPLADNREYETVVLAALLHDIGKFLQRGRSLDFNVSGTHPEVSANFVNAFSDSFTRFSDTVLLKILVQYHHRGPGVGGFSADNVSDPHSRMLALLINKADSLSASERGTHTEQWQNYKTTPLVSLFPNIFNTTTRVGQMKHHPFSLPPPLDMLKTDLFPAAFNEYGTGELEVTLKNFGAQARSLLTETGQDFYGSVSHLLSLLSTYVPAIPSDTQEEIPDISLFDHLKTTAAIASCLYLYHKENNLLTEASLFKYKDPFLLAVGDVSGIQDYCLRGRGHIQAAQGAFAVYTAYQRSGARYDSQ